MEFGFDFKQDKDAILAKLQEVRYHNGRSTFTGVGLKIVVESVRSLSVIKCIKILRKYPSINIHEILVYRSRVTIYFHDHLTTSFGSFEYNTNN